MGDVRLFGVYDSSGNEIPDTEDLSRHSRYKNGEVVFEATEIVDNALEPAAAAD